MAHPAILIAALFFLPAGAVMFGAWDEAEGWGDIVGGVILAGLFVAFGWVIAANVA